MPERGQRGGDLDVYRKLLDLYLGIRELSMGFPQSEMYELGSQMRRSSNSAPANLAEGFNNRHLNIYLEAITRATGEVRESQHHLMIANRKGYLSQDEYESLVGEYANAARMLRGLQHALEASRDRSASG